MRAKIMMSLVAVLGTAGCATAGIVGHCPEVAKAAPAKSKSPATATKPAPSAAKGAPAAPGKTATAAKTATTATAAKPAQPATTAKHPKTAATKPADAGHWPTYAAALAKAKAAHKPLLLDFSTVWCTACKLYERAIEPDASVQWLLHQVVYVSYDAEHGAGVAVATHFAVDAFPTFVLVGDDGKVAWRHEGSPPTAGGFFDALGEALAPLLTEGQVKALLAGKDPRARMLAAQWDLDHGREAAAKAQFQAVVHADATGRRHLGARALQALQSLRAGKALAREARRADLELVRRFPGSQDAPQALADLVRLSPLGDKAVGAAARKILAAHAHDHDALNQLVYTLLEGGFPKIAVAAGQAQVKLSPKDANAYDTLGEALLAAGRQADAVAASKHAVALATASKDPQLPGYSLDLARYQKGNPSPEVLQGQRSNAKAVAALDRIDLGTLLFFASPVSPDPTPSPQAQFQTGLHARLNAAGEACQPEAGALQVAWVRLILPSKGGTPSTVLVLEPGASKALRQCLVQHLSQASFPSQMAYAQGAYAVVTQPVRLTR